MVSRETLGTLLLILLLVSSIGLIIIGTYLYLTAPLLPDVRNAYIAMDWAMNQGIVCPCDMMTCEEAVHAYMEAHNLTPEEFPYVCWPSDEGPPKSPEEKLGLKLMLFGVVGLAVFSLFSWVEFDAC